MATQGRLLLLITILVSLLGPLQAQQMVPCNSQQPQGSNTDPPLPPLPDQFQVHVEANIVQKQLTRNVVEYYDYTNNRAVIESHDHSSSERVRTVMDFRTEEAHVLYENGTCWYVTTNSSNNHFGFMRAANGSHIKTVKELLYFGEQMGETFIDGDKTVRGIPVNHWQACVKIPMANGTFTLDYYFSKGPGYSIDGEEIQVPVRAVINGSAHSVDIANKSVSPDKHDFYHVYDFTDFHPGPIKDESVFEIPIGTYCKSNVFKKAAPKIPHQFSAGLEASIRRGAGNPRFVNEQMYYDGPANVMRVDLAGPTTRMDAMQYGKRPLSVIHDETNGMRYIIDRWEGNCSVIPYRPTQGMITPEDVMAMFDGDFLYQGKKTLRGISVESWSKLNASANIITEVLFQQQSAPDERPMVPKRQKRSVPAPGRGAYAVYVPVGIYVGSMTKNTRIPEAQYNVFGFIPGHPDPDVFDISPCYEFGHKYAYMSMKIEGSYERDVLYNNENLKQPIGHKTSGNGTQNLLNSFSPEHSSKRSYERDVLYNKREFETALRSAIARGAGVSVMRVTSILGGNNFETTLTSAIAREAGITVRITSILVEADTFGTNHLRTFFKILDNSLSGASGSRLTSLAAARLNLASSIASGLNFDVQYPTIEQNFEVVSDTLWEIKSTYTDSETAGIQRYSKGAMAGLGIGMVVIGCLLGLVVAYMIYKRIDTSVPYEITN